MGIVTKIGAEYRYIYYLLAQKLIIVRGELQSLSRYDEKSVRL